MRGLVWHGADKLLVGEVDEPSAGPGEVVVDVLLAGICGSDLHAYCGRSGGRRPPLVLGHEAVGRVHGSDQPFALFPIMGCGNCRLCRNGLDNLCPQRSLLGFNRQGALAERVAIPEKCLVALPDGLSLDDAVLAEPLATSLSVLAANGPAGDITILGCGSIGLLALHAALHADRTSQVVITVADPVASRRQMALDLGAARAHPGVDGPPAASADLVLDTVGVEETWAGALRVCRPGGTVAIIGLGQSAGNVEIGHMVRFE